MKTQPRVDGAGPSAACARCRRGGRSRAGALVAQHRGEGEGTELELPTAMMWMMKRWSWSWCRCGSRGGLGWSHAARPKCRG